MASTYSRPHLPFPDQLELLKRRGLIVVDETSALAWLRKLGYYRLSAYWHPFRQRKLVAAGQNRVTWQVDDTFQGGASFEDAVELYLYDKQLRLLVIDAIEQIEVAIRVDIAHHLGAQDVFAHENTALLDGKFTRAGRNGTSSNHESWLTKLAESTDRSKEEFVTHYKSKYGIPLPIWVCIEVWDFGLLSRFYEGMRFADKAALCQRFGFNRPDLMVTWLRTINYLRNIAAHHCRLWNRNIVDQPKMPRLGDIPVFDTVLADMSVERVYPALCIIAYLLDQTNPGSGWARRLTVHLERFPHITTPKIDTGALGCPASWRQHPFWPV